jgi:Ca2+-binding RTX toxin-like protein
VEDTIQIRLDGGVGHDFLSADATILGGSGDDYLEGGPGVDHLCGLAGNDTLFGGNDFANDLYDGGTEFDTILVYGTQPNSSERINLRQNDFIPIAINVCDNPITQATSLDYEILDIDTGALYVTETDTIVTNPGTGTTVEEVRIEARAGADIIQVATADALFNDPGYSLRITVVGGADTTRDRLAVVDDGTDDLVLYRKSDLDSAGTVTVGPGNAEPFEIQFEQVEVVQFVDENGSQINDAGIENPPPGANVSRLVVFKHDPFEYNDDRFTATHVGANQTVNLDPTIDPGPAVGQGAFGLPLLADVDY